VNANTPDFRPENEGPDPEKVLDYIHAKDGNGKVVTVLRPLSGFGKRAAINSGRFLGNFLIVKQIARAFYRLFARYRYKLSGDRRQIGPRPRMRSLT
jgi:predicted DCC family thiol-disulfide oxidoreductase YuxK